MKALRFRRVSDKVLRILRNRDFEYGANTHLRTQYCSKKCCSKLDGRSLLSVAMRSRHVFLMLIHGFVDNLGAVQISSDARLNAFTLVGREFALGLFRTQIQAQLNEMEVNETIDTKGATAISWGKLWYCKRTSLEYFTYAWPTCRSPCCLMAASTSSFLGWPP